MPDLERRAVVKFGLTLSEFWDSTPRELELLLERSAYKTELGLNEARHIMAVVANTTATKKTKPQGYKPQDMMRLPLIDGKITTVEEAKNKQAEVDEALRLMKLRHKKKNGS